MKKQLLKPLMYAIAALALTAGSATATAYITGANVLDESLTGADVRNGSLTAADLPVGSGKIKYRTIDGEYSTMTPGAKVRVQVLCDYQHGEYAVGGGGRDYSQSSVLVSSLPVTSGAGLGGPALGWQVVLKSDGHDFGKAFVVCAKQA